MLVRLSITPARSALGNRSSVKPGPRVEYDSDRYSVKLVKSSKEIVKPKILDKAGIASSRNRRACSPKVRSADR